MAVRKVLAIVGLAIGLAWLVGACSGDKASDTNPGGNFTVAGGTGAIGQGAAGAAGSAGASGTGGSAGAAGAAGSAGASGTGGSAGAAAPAGSAGAADAAGSAGAAGAAGAAGENGDSGTAGEDGEAGSGGSAGSSSNACLDGITDYAKTGPFKFTAKVSGSVNIWVPTVPAGCKVPMVHLANGTFGYCGFYQPSLDLLASHGFLTLCYESTMTGAGDQGITAFETALKEYPDLADYKFGSTGHSQGGQSSFVVLQFAEAKWGDKGVYAGLAEEPASGFGAQPTAGTWQQIYAKIKSPVFMFSGLGTDGLVAQSWVQQAYDALSPDVEAYFWTANGANHMAPNPEQQDIEISWFRWKLLGDQKACEYFKAIPSTNTKWAEVASQNVQPCK